jgi:ubiquitin
MVAATKAQTPEHQRSERIKNLKRKRRAEEAIQQERAAAA